MTKSISTKKNAAAEVQGTLPNAPDAPRPPAAIGHSKSIAPSTSSGARGIPAPKSPSKQDKLAALVVRDQGATLDQMVAALSWLPHTTRAALTGLKKKGFAITSDKVDGIRTYRGVSPQ